MRVQSPTPLSALSAVCCLQLNIRFHSAFCFLVPGTMCCHGNRELTLTPLLWRGIEDPNCWVKPCTCPRVRHGFGVLISILTLHSLSSFFPLFLFPSFLAPTSLLFYHASLCPPLRPTEARRVLPITWNCGYMWL